MRLPIMLLLALLCWAAQAAETAFTVRPTELKAKPFIDAATVATLPENQQVQVLKRDAGWYQVKARGASGWVAMTNLRFPAASAGKAGGGANQSFLGAALGGKRSTSTTGAKGLTREDLQTARPNPQALQAAEKLAVSKADASQFARAGKLVPKKIDYLEE